jgi:hypothetical protein
MSAKSKLADAKIPSLLAGVAPANIFVAARAFPGVVTLLPFLYAERSRRIDILATNQDASRSITIQCKTNQIGNKSWVLSDKSERYQAENHFYVFVALGAPTERASYYCPELRGREIHFKKPSKVAGETRSC